MTIVYLIRHSKPLKVNNDLNCDDLQMQNEKTCLSIEGEELAQKKLETINDVDILFSSNYVRAIQTAKYLTLNNDLEVNVVSDLGERRFGISSWNEKPENFERKQFTDEDYKIGSGESQKEVRERMYNAIMNIIDKNNDKKIAIVSHATAISYFLRKWCDVSVVDDKLKYSFNGKVLLHGFLDYCDIFKLEFDNDNNLINVEIL